MAEAKISQAKVSRKGAPEDENDTSHRPSQKIADGGVWWEEVHQAEKPLNIRHSRKRDPAVAIVDPDSDLGVDLESAPDQDQAPHDLELDAECDYPEEDTSPKHSSGPYQTIHDSKADTNLDREDYGFWREQRKANQASSRGKEGIGVIAWKILCLADSCVSSIPGKPRPAWNLNLYVYSHSSFRIKHALPRINCTSKQHSQ